MLNKLFTKHPSEIFTHPPGLSSNPGKIEVGPIAGWLCYAPVFETLRCVEFEPVVVVEDDREYIEVKTDHREGKTRFWYVNNSGRLGYPNYPCWYQSDSTLRFMRK